MGNIFDRSALRTKGETTYPTIPRMENQDLKKIRDVWRIVEKDSAYYGFAMCTVIFRNHPQYRKYFENETIPVFVQEAKVKKKFTMICDLVSALFLHYSGKAAQRDYLLAYIAMVHKDMGLTIEDFRNFMSDITASLIIELPHIMNEERVLIQTKHFDILNEVLFHLMDVCNKEMSQLLAKNTGMNKCCPWKTDPESQVMYGYPLKYWLYKKRYWEYRKALWASIEANTVNSTVNGNDNGDDNGSVKFYASPSRQKALENTRTYRKRVVRAHTGDKNVTTTDSDPASDDDRDFSPLKRTSRLLYKKGERRGTVAEVDRSPKVSITRTVDENGNGPDGRGVDDGVPSKANDERDDDNGTKTFDTQKASLLKLADDKDPIENVAHQTARERKRMRNMRYVY